MRRVHTLLAFAGIVALGAVPVQAMTVAQFIAKADALKAQGMKAMLSKDLKLMKAEMQGIGAAYRADLLTARQAGRPAHSCPPAKGKAKLNANDLMAELRAIPAAAQRTTSTRAAFYAMMKKRYPCA